MQTFSLLGFAAHLAKLGVAMAVEEHHALEHAANVIEKEAKAEIGTYQDAVGPFPQWQQLADTTLNGFMGFPGKIELGYATAGQHNPLLREGDMRESIEHTVGVREAYIGSNSDVAFWQELGTSKIPARSFLGGAAVRKAPSVAHEIGGDIVTVLMAKGLPAKIP